MSKLCMQPTLIEAKDLDELWFRVLYGLFHNEDEDGNAKAGIHHYKIDDGSYAGDTRLEYDMVMLHVVDPGGGPLVPTVGAGQTPPADANQVREEYFPRYLMSDVKTDKEDYTYGERLVNAAYPIARTGPREWTYKVPGGYNVNQIDQVIEKFKRSGFNTNQCTMEIAMPGDIILGDPPCMRLIDWRVQDGKLHMFTYFRSWDATYGLPANLAGLELMKQFVAGELGLGNGEITAASKGLHCYGQYYPYVGARLNLSDEEVALKMSKYK